MEGSEAYSFSCLQTILVSKPRHLKEIRETELFTIVPIQLPLKYSTSRSMYCRSEEEAQTLDNLFLLSGSFHSPDSRQLWIFSISRGFFIPFFYQIVLACYDRTRRYSQHHGSKHDTIIAPFRVSLRGYNDEKKSLLRAKTGNKKHCCGQIHPTASEKPLHPKASDGATASLGRPSRPFSWIFIHHPFAVAVNNSINNRHQCRFGFLKRLL